MAIYRDEVLKMIDEHVWVYVLPYFVTEKDSGTSSDINRLIKGWYERVRERVRSIDDALTWRYFSELYNPGKGKEKSRTKLYL